MSTCLTVTTGKDGGGKGLPQGMLGNCRLPSCL